MYKLMLFGFLITTFVMLNIYCFGMYVDADTLFPYRYINALLSDTPSLLIVQPGSRIFIEWFYSWIVMMFTHQIERWSDGVLFINCALLFFGIGYFLKHLRLFDMSQIIYLLISVFAVIPVLGVLQNNYVHYYMFMHGTHAFLLPFVFVYFGFLMKHLNQDETNWFGGLLLLLILSLLVASNLLIVLMVVGPLICVLLWLLVTGFSDKQNIFSALGFLLISVVLGVLLLFSFEQLFPHISLMKNSYPILEQGWAQWFTENRTFRHLSDRSRSGYIREVMLMAVMTAIFCLIYFRKKPHQPFYLLVVFYLASFLGFFLVAWLTNKNHIRYIPHLMFLAPLVIFLAMKQLRVIKSFAPLAGLMFLSFLLVLIFKGHSSYDEKKRFKVGLSDINSELMNVKQQYALNGDGLSDYWFSHSFVDDSLLVLPMTKGVRKNVIKAVTWATDLNTYWQFEENHKIRRKFNFVINYKFLDKSRWVINEHVMQQNLGTYDEVVKFSKGIYDYQVYIYKKGVQSAALYMGLESYLTTIE